MKYVKRWNLLPVILLLVCLFSVSAWAAPSRVGDQAGLFTEEESSRLRSKIDSLSAELKFDIVVVTSDDLGGKSYVDYADDYYDWNGFGYGSGHDGALLLISTDPEDRICYISTCGYGIEAMTDAGINFMLDRIVDEHFHQDDYYGAADTFVDLCGSFVTQAKTGSPYDVGNLPREPMSAGKLSRWLVVALLVGCVVGAVYVFGLQSTMKSVHGQQGAGSYLVKGSMQIREARDFFLYRTVSRTRIERSEPRGGGGGGSTVHTSSSGTSHGGGGRR